MSTPAHHVRAPIHSLNKELTEGAFLPQLDLRQPDESKVLCRPLVGGQSLVLLACETQVSIRGEAARADHLLAVGALDSTGVDRSALIPRGVGGASDEHGAL